MSYDVRANIITLGQGPALVFFHGFGFSHSIWLELANVLKTRYTLFLVDLPGFGDTPLMDWDAFKSELLEALPPRFALIGWSMGGLFATRLAIEESFRVSHLFNIATSPQFIKEHDWPGIEKPILDEFLASMIATPVKTLEQFIRLQLLNHSGPIPLVLAPNTEGLTTGLNVLATWDLRPFLAELSMPVCYVFGRLDSIVSSKTMTVMQKYYPHMQYLLLAKSAHAPFLSHQDEFVNALETFLTF